MSVSVDKLYEAYGRLDRQLKDRDFEAAISTANAILSVKKDELEAVQAICYSLVQLDQYDKLLDFLGTTTLISKDQQNFQKAYCLYRLQRHSEALNVIGMVKEPTPALLHLQAQSLFRLEDPLCAKVYRQIFESTKSPSTELLVNLTASLTRSKQTDAVKAVLKEQKSKISESFDLAYNAACASIEAGNLSEAHQLLETAEKICRKELTSQGASSEELESELAPILTQLAFIKQQQGSEILATTLYENVLKNTPSDLAVSAVCNNNLVSIRFKESSDSFNSLNRLSTLSKRQTQEKLSIAQKRVIAFNRCLLLLHHGKYEECNFQLRQLNQDFPNTEFSTLMQASIHIKKQQPNKAIEVLREFVRVNKENPNVSPRVHLSLAQLQLNQGNTKDAILILKSVTSMQGEPALISTIVQLCLTVGDVSGAILYLDELAKKAQSQKKYDVELVVTVLKISAQLKMENNMWSAAAETLSRILELNPNDVQIKATLALALSTLDSSKAEKILSTLPNINPATNVDALEASTGPARRVEITAAQASAPASSHRPGASTSDPSNPSNTASSPAAVPIAKQKKKRRRKNKPAKKAQPGQVADPERWIPRHLRTQRRRGGAGGASSSGAPRGQTHAVGRQGTTANEATINRANVPTPSNPKANIPPKAVPKGAAKRGRGGRRR